MFLRFDGLLEDRFPATILLTHGLRGGLHVAEGFRLYSLGVRDNGSRLSIDLQNRTATRTSHFEIGRLLRHLGESYRKTLFVCEDPTHA